MTTKRRQKKDFRCRVRLGAEVVRSVAHASDLNNRSIPQEVNYALGIYYAHLQATHPKYRL